MVACFAGAWLTADSESFRLLHVTLGYTMAGLVAFRLVWGVVGTRHARFASFVRGPAAVLAYLKSMLVGRPEHHVGHNPAGALAIVALLGLTAAVAATGWAQFEGLGGEWLEDAHEIAANLMLFVVGIHLAGVIVGSLAHRENLVAAMVTGSKHGAGGDGIARAWRALATVMLVAVLGFWWWQWQSAPAGGLMDGAAATEQRDGHGRGRGGRSGRGHDDDD
nr:cytochrome b/b6 domain-containing protein [Rubrivivax sp. A210]